MARGWAWDILALGAALGLFGALALYQLDLPGLYYDEAADAVPAMQLLLGQPTAPVRGAAIVLGDKAIPLMVMDYVGTVNTVLLLPFLALGGVSVVAMRLMAVLAAAITIGLTYLLGREFLSRPAAAAAALLLAAHPSFVFFSRQGIHVTSVMSLLAIAAFYCFYRWRQRGQARFLHWAAFLLGVGLWAKVLFLWFILAFVVGYVVLILVRRGRHLSWAQGAGAGGFFLLGAGPLLLYNLQTQGTLQVLGANLARSQAGVNNQEVAANLLARLDNLRVLLDGGFFWFLGHPSSAPVYPYLFGVTMIGGIAVTWGQRRPTSRHLLFLVLFITLVFLQSAVTISGLWATHLYALLPFLMLLFGASLQVLARLIRWGAVVALVVAMALAGMSLQVDWRYHQALSDSGGLVNHSDAIYRLADYLAQKGEKTVAMDWGLATSLQLLTQGRVNPEEIFGYSPEADPGFPHRLYPHLVGGPQLFLFHTPGFTVYPRFEAFQELVTRLGQRAILEQRFAQRDGSPLLLVYRVEDATP